MRNRDVISASPVSFEKTVRGEEVRVLTSCRAGKIVPLAYIPVLREDRVSSGRMSFRFQMAETIHPLMNAVGVVVNAHFVPFLAEDHFSGMESFDKSYQGVKERDADAAPVPFFKTVTFNKNAAFWKTLGIHHPAGQINRAPLAAYNTVVNYRRKARSAKLPLRAMDDATLAEAFWTKPSLAHIVPDFEAAMMDGEVPLTLSGRAPVLGLGFAGTATGATATNVRYSDGSLNTGSHFGQSGTSQLHADLQLAPTGAYWPDIFADLAQGGVVNISLANIDLAKKVTAFAKLREQYSGLSDDHIIDLLMEGIRVPEEVLKQPILLARKSTVFGYNERHAMDGDNLDKSVTTGRTVVDISFRTPPMNTGGTIIFTAEIVPDQLHERMLDSFLAATVPGDLPNALEDYLDPDKVEVVQNKFVDVLHGSPTGVFGYAPLNHAWKRSLTRIGGRFYRPSPDTFVEDRQRFWSYEVLNPSLTDDFYLVGDLSHSVFMDTLADPFEITALGGCQIVGNTQFGKQLMEDEGHYDAVFDAVDTTRVVSV